MPLTMRQRPARPWARRAALVLGIGVLLGFAGPFGAYPPLSLPVRYGFWIGMAVAGYGAALAADRLVPGTAIARPDLRLAAVAIASAVPLTFVAAWAVSLVRPGHLYNPLQLPALFGAVVAVQLVLVFTLLRRPHGPAQPAPDLLAPEQPAPAPAGDGKGRFPHALLSRLPSRLGDEIIALEAEDHYLRIHTTLGSELVLMRLSDAIAAIGPELGLQVHRSWWVADDAIRAVIRSKQRSRLKLSNGLLVPVGRTYSAAVRSRSARLALEG